MTRPYELIAPEYADTFNRAYDRKVDDVAMCGWLVAQQRFNRHWPAKLVPRNMTEYYTKQAEIFALLDTRTERDRHRKVVA